MSEKAKILIVDDQRSVRTLLATHMEEEGYIVDQAENGEAALELALNKKYNLILLDVVMSGIDGFEVCKRIKEHSKYKNTPIIFVTGQSEEAANIKGYGVGSVDYIEKPININKLILKVGIYIKNSILMDKLEVYQGRMQADMKKASAFYHAFLPDTSEIESIQEEYNVKLDSYFLPYNEIGGDFWKVIAIDKNKFGILSIDFSGHGIASALNVAYTNAILSHDIKWSDPVQVMTFLNDHLNKVLINANFATAIYFVFDKKKQSITYVNCAAPYPILITESGNDAVFYEVSSRPVGIWSSDELNLQSEKIYLNKGETFLICSDVILESKHAITKKRWMLEGLKNTIIKMKAEPEERLEVLCNIFLETAKKPLSDDLTLISIHSKKD